MSVLAVTAAKSDHSKYPQTSVGDLLKMSIGARLQFILENNPKDLQPTHLALTMNLISPMSNAGLNRLKAIKLPNRTQ